eukprot:gene15208-22050_t
MARPSGQGVMLIYLRFYPAVNLDACNLSQSIALK